MLLTHIVLAPLLRVAPGAGVLVAAVALDEVAEVAVGLDADPFALLVLTLATHLGRRRGRRGRRRGRRALRHLAGVAELGVAVGHL